MRLPDPSRRDFLRTTGVLAVGGGMALSLAGCRESADSAAEAMRAGEGPRVLTPDEVRALEAFSDAVLPPDGDAPGAAALGAVVFMDHYADRRPDVLEQLRGATTALSRRVEAAHPGLTNLADLDPSQRDAFMGALTADAPEVFWPLQTLVIFGAFAAPAQGGNRDQAGWELMGYDARMAWQPPFGFYDAQAAQGDDR